VRLWITLSVTYVCAKFGNDRLWNEKALADRKFGSNNTNNKNDKNNVGGHWRPVPESNKTAACRNWREVRLKQKKSMRKWTVKAMDKWHIRTHFFKVRHPVSCILAYWCLESCRTCFTSETEPLYTFSLLHHILLGKYVADLESTENATSETVDTDHSRTNDLKVQRYRNSVNL